MTITAFTRRTILAGTAAIVGLASLPALAQDGTAEGKSVEYITFGLQFEYQVAMVEGMLRAAEEAGIDLNVIDGKGDPNMQVTQALEGVTKQPDAIILNPIDATLLVAGVKRANEAGGAMGADALAELVGGEGTVLETRGSVGSAQAQARHKGFTERMESAYPDITVRSLNTEWEADNANSMVLDAFTQNPDIAGVFSHNDEMVRGVVSALRQIGRLVPPEEDGHVAIVGLDGTPLALDRIRCGTQDATVAQDPYAMGGQGILQQVIAYLEGEDYDDRMRTLPYVIDASNVDEDRHWGNLDM